MYFYAWFLMAYNIINPIFNPTLQMPDPNVSLFTNMEKSNGGLMSAPVN